MGPFIQGRMVLPFWLERTESLFLSSCRRQTAAGPSGESLNYIYTVSLSQEMARKSSSSLYTENQHREMLT